MKRFMAFFTFVVFFVTFQSCSGQALPEKEPGVLDTIISRFDRQFDERIGVSIPGAVIVFIKDGEVYYKQAFGYKDLETQTRMTADTVFQAASLSKPISALGIMRLVEEGLISLDDPVEKYLTRWRIPDSEFNSQGVTFRSLLCHAAGIIDTGEYPPLFPPGVRLPSIEQYLSGYPYARTKAVLAIEPGTVFAYLNSGYSILQLAIEEITGKSFSEYMRANVLQPMDMINSSFIYDPVLRTRLATPYHTVALEAPLSLIVEEAAYGLYTTAGDLANFIVELMKCYKGEENNFILNRSTLSLMLSPQTSKFTTRRSWLPHFSMALGFFVNHLSNGAVTHAHSGRLRGWRTHYEFNLETGNGVIILTNGDMGHGALISLLVPEWQRYIDSL
jgi:CubicO group peptidase (beta-lactamase class C family)